MAQLPLLLLMPFLFVFGLVLLVILSATFGEQTPPREEILAELASKIGWDLDVEKDREFRQQFPQFHDFQRGDDRYAYNRMTGERQFAEGEPTLECLAGDYHYETEETRTRKVGDRTETYTETVEHEFSYLLVRLPYPSEGDLHVYPETFFDRIGAFLGFDDIDFESAEFSKAFSVNSKDKRFAYDLIHPRMMEYLLETRPKGFRIEGGYLLQTSGWHWKPEELEQRVDWVAGFFANWPRHLQSTP